MLNPSVDQAAPYHRPRPGTKTGRVWEIADEITREKDRPAKRREVIERFTAEHGNANTANTQYQYWRAWHKLQPGPLTVSSTKPCDVEPQSFRVAPDGRFSIPLEMREAMQLQEDGRVTVRVEAGELRVVSPAVAVKQVQSRMRKYKKSGVSIVDQFLKDRRTMWGEE